MASFNSTVAGAPPPPPSDDVKTPPPPYTLGCESASNCIYFDVSDREILTSLAVFACMASVLLVLFGSVRHKMPIYFGRRRLRNLVGINVMRFKKKKK